MSQRARVLAALRSRGADGVCAPDFLAPDVLDGGKPITRLAARVLELRKDGHEIIEEGRRNRCSVYRLMRDAQDAPTPPPAPEYVDRDLALWADSGSVARTSAIYGDDWNEAA